MTGPATRLSVRALSKQQKTVLRVLMAALAVCAVSFAAGVVGDLSLAAPSGPAATVSIPVDSDPAPALAVTEAAAAATAPVARHAVIFAPLEKPRRAREKAQVKPDPDRAPKG